MDKMREEFETWFYSEIDGNSVLEDLCWQAWQASRSALVVDLPVPENDTEEGYLDYIKESLRESGVGYE